MAVAAEDAVEADEIAAFVGPLVCTRPSRPCPMYIEITFIEGSFGGADGARETTRMSQSSHAQEEQLHAIAFQNYYCAAISIHQQQPANYQRLSESYSYGVGGGGASGRGGASSSAAASSRYGGTDDEENVWVPVLERHRLMKHAHTEADAQDWHVVRTAQFNSAYVANLRYPLRIYLMQPSPLWKTVELRRVKCYAPPPAPANTKPKKHASGAGADNVRLQDPQAEMVRLARLVVADAQALQNLLQAPPGTS